MVVSFFLFSQTTQAACTNVPLSGDYTVSESCTFSASAGVFGVDDGNLIIASGQTLTINNGQTVVWGPGKSVIINGTIAINEGGQLKQTRIWVKDSDGDGYPTTDTPIAQDTSPGTGYVTRSNLNASMTYTTDLAYDYDDNDSSTYPGTTCDYDQDGSKDICTINKDNGECGFASASTQGPTPDEYVKSGTKSPSATQTCYFRDWHCTGNSAAETYDDIPQYSCGTCAYISDADCTGGTKGSCSYYSASTQGPTADYYYDNGADSPSGTNYCVLRDYHCTGNSAAETYDDITVATCGPCKYCNGSSCANYSNTTDCGLCRKCNGSGSCSNWYSAGSKDTTSPGTCTATHYRCDGSGNCTAPVGSCTVQACINNTTGSGKYTCNSWCSNNGYYSCCEAHKYGTRDCSGTYSTHNCTQEFLRGASTYGGTRCVCKPYVYD